MNRILLNIVLLAAIIFLGAAGCAQQTVPQKTKQPEIQFNEDLKAYRPNVKVVDETPQKEAQEVIQNSALETPYDISDQLKALTDSMVAKNDSIRMIDGFTVLVYSGNNEIEAGRVRNRLFDIVPDLEAQYTYKLPTYFVKVGQFYQRIEAQPLYRKLRAYYPSASIVPDKFPISE